MWYFDMTFSAQVSLDLDAEMLHVNGALGEKEGGVRESNFKGME